MEYIPSLLIESSLVGVVCWIIGTIIFNLSMNISYETNNISTCGVSDYCIDNKKSSKPIGIGLAFFTTGFVLHLLLQSVGFSKWICDRHTRWGFKCLAQCSNPTYHSDIHPASIMIKN